MGRLFKTHQLEIRRKLPDSGYYTDGGEYIESSSTDNFTIQCSVQPFRSGISQIELPDGVRSTDARLVYTQDTRGLLTNIEQSNQDPDLTTIDGLVYECFNVEPWTGYNLRTDHTRAVFVRSDKLGGVT